MKILHLELAGFYNENTLYQTNLLAYYNTLDGHETIVISSNYEWKEGKIISTQLCDKKCDNGVRLIRMPYYPSVQSYYHQKIRNVPGLYNRICELEPDVILCHCTQFISILDVIKYIKNHPKVLLYVDTHTAEYNSGRNCFSRIFLHRCFYRFLARVSEPYITKYLYIGESEKQFSLKYYGIDESIMEFYPLGGTVLENDTYFAFRDEIRNKHIIEGGQLLFVHSGKMNVQKKTIELLKAFKRVELLNAKLFIIGSLADDVKEEVLKLIDSDDRVQYLGWMQADELQKYLAACDLYLQPGSVSATMQNAVCMRCPVMVYPHLPYTKDLDYGNLIWVKNEVDIERAFRGIEVGEIDLSEMTRNSEKCGRELLDYRKLAARLYE